MVEGTGSMLESQQIAELIGRTIVGCRVLEPIAAGRAGAIVAGERIATGQAVALRIFHPYLTDVRGFEERLAVEAPTAIGQRHWHLQRIYTFGRDGRNVAL